MHATILNHDSWELALVFLGATREEAEAKATRELHAQTAEFRGAEGEDWECDPVFLNGDEDEDARWVALCLSEDWTLQDAVVHE